MDEFAPAWHPASEHWEVTWTPQWQVLWRPSYEIVGWLPHNHKRQCPSVAPHSAPDMDDADADDADQWRRPRKVARRQARPSSSAACPSGWFDDIAEDESELEIEGENDAGPPSGPPPGTPSARPWPSATHPRIQPPSAEYSLVREESDGEPDGPLPEAPIAKVSLKNAKRASLPQACLLATCPHYECKVARKEGARIAKEVFRGRPRRGKATDHVRDDYYDMLFASQASEAASADEASAEVEEGCAVEVFGLESESGKALNGKRGVVGKFLRDKVRFKVDLGSQLTPSIKPCNLRRIGPSAAAPTARADTAQENHAATAEETTRPTSSGELRDLFVPAGLVPESYSKPTEVHVPVGKPSEARTTLSPAVPPAEILESLKRLGKDDAVDVIARLFRARPQVGPAIYKDSPFAIMKAMTESSKENVHAIIKSVFQEKPEWKSHQ